MAAKVPADTMPVAGNIVADATAFDDRSGARGGAPVRARSWRLGGQGVLLGARWCGVDINLRHRPAI